jgi:hypothetical protein
VDTATVWRALRASGVAMRSPADGSRLAAISLADKDRGGVVRNVQIGAVCPEYLLSNARGYETLLVGCNLYREVGSSGVAR